MLATYHRLVLRSGPHLRTVLRTRSYAAAAHNEQIDYDLDNYPKLPDKSRQYRSALGWQDSLERRNIGEPLHEQEELYSMWGPDIPPIAPETALFRFALVALGFVGFGFTVKYVVAPDAPMVRRTLPFSGLRTELGGETQARAEDESEAD